MSQQPPLARSLPPSGSSSSYLDEMRGCRLYSDCDEFIVLSIPLPDQLATVPEFTAAERDIVERILQGQSNRAIAEARGSCPATVRNQIHALFDKLGVHSRTQLAAALIPRLARLDCADPAAGDTDKLSSCP